MGRSQERGTEMKYLSSHFKFRTHMAACTTKVVGDGLLFLTPCITGYESYFYYPRKLYFYLVLTVWHPNLRGLTEVMHRGGAELVIPSVTKTWGKVDTLPAGRARKVLSNEAVVRHCISWWSPLPLPARPVVNSTHPPIKGCWKSQKKILKLDT